MDSLTLDKIFVLDNFSFVQDKKHFVRADGWGIKLWQKFCLWNLYFVLDKKASSICMDKITFVHDNIEIVQDKNFVQG